MTVVVVVAVTVVVVVAAAVVVVVMGNTPTVCSGPYTVAVATGQLQRTRTPGGDRAVCHRSLTSPRVRPRSPRRRRRRPRRGAREIRLAYVCVRMRLRVCACARPE